MMYSEPERTPDLLLQRTLRDISRDANFSGSGVEPSENIHDFELTGLAALTNMIELIMLLRNTAEEADTEFLDELMTIIGMLGLNGSPHIGKVMGFGYNNPTFADAKESFFSVDYVNAIESHAASEG